jgi:V8-like Glu-specific endopeptidase
VSKKVDVRADYGFLFTNVAMNCIIDTVLKVCYCLYMPRKRKASRSRTKSSLQVRPDRNFLFIFLSVFILLTVALLFFGQKANDTDNISTHIAYASRDEDRSVNYPDQIIEGMIPEEGRWPFVVEIIVEDDVRNTRYRWCSGSLIHEEWVVTSAHCVTDENGEPTKIQPNEGYVIADITNDTDKENRKTARITDVYVHPAYASSDVRERVSFDVALLRIERNKMEDVPVLALATSDYSKSYNRYVIGLGWGYRQQAKTGVDMEGYLGEAVMRIISVRELNESFEDVRLDNLSDTLTFPPYICHGDSGGPLIKWHEQRQRYELIGIAALMPESSDRKMLYNPCHPGTVAIQYTDIVGEKDSQGRTVRDYITEIKGKFRGGKVYKGDPIEEVHCNVNDDDSDMTIQRYKSLPYCYKKQGYVYRRGCSDTCRDDELLCRYAESFIGCLSEEEIED